MRVALHLIALAALSCLSIKAEVVNWDNFWQTKKGGAKVSENHIQDLLRSTIGQFQLAEFDTWSGSVDSQNRAEGDGRLSMKLLVGEAGGLRRFQRSLHMTGRMKKGRFISQVRIKVDHPQSFGFETKVGFSDGLVVFTTRDEFEAHQRVMKQVLAEHSRKIERLKSKTSKPQLETIVSEAKRQRDTLADPGDRAVVDRVISMVSADTKSFAKITAVILSYLGLKKLGPKIARKTPLGFALYHLYVLINDFVFA